MSSSADGNATDYGNYNPTMQAIHARISKETMEEIKDMCTKHGWTLNPMSVNILLKEDGKLDVGRCLPMIAMHFTGIEYQGLLRKHRQFHLHACYYDKHQKLVPALQCWKTVHYLHAALKQHTTSVVVTLLG